MLPVGIGSNGGGSSNWFFDIWQRVVGSKKAPRIMSYLHKTPANKPNRRLSPPPPAFARLWLQNVKNRAAWPLPLSTLNHFRAEFLTKSVQISLCRLAVPHQRKTILNFKLQTLNC
jgi:hypothetical protein